MMRLTLLTLFSALTLLAGALAQARIEKLPPGLQSQEERLEVGHREGIEDFFMAQNEDCDAWDVLDLAYTDVRTSRGAPPMFRLESRVRASCLRQEVWFCYSSYLADGTYRYTDCEVDVPLYEE